MYIDFLESTISFTQGQKNSTAQIDPSTSKTLNVFSLTLIHVYAPFISCWLSSYSLILSRAHELKQIMNNIRHI